MNYNYRLYYDYLKFRLYCMFKYDQFTPKICTIYYYTDKGAFINLTDLFNLTIDNKYKSKIMQKFGPGRLEVTYQYLDKAYFIYYLFPSENFVFPPDGINNMGGLHIKSANLKSEICEFDITAIINEFEGPSADFHKRRIESVDFLLMINIYILRFPTMMYKMLAALRTGNLWLELWYPDKKVIISDILHSPSLKETHLWAPKT